MSICQNTLGIDPSQIRETVLLSPGWPPERLFPADALRVLQESSPLHGYKLWDVQLEHATCTYLRTGFGATVAMDATLLLQHTPCKRILFVSSAGGLGADMRVGDLLLPAVSACGDGSIRYLFPDASQDRFGQPFRPDPAAFAALRAITERVCAEQNVHYHIGNTFCVATLVAQQPHIPTLAAKGYDSLDMESSAIFAAAQTIGIAACALMQISDTQQHPLLQGRSDRSADYKKRVRRNALPRILLEMLAQPQ